MQYIQKSIPIHAHITITGGGLAGVCAAISAARLGSTVSLIQNRPVLGGNSSSEIRVWTRGSTGGGNLFSEEMGIIGELKLTNQYKNPEGNPILWDEILLDAILAEPNISLFLNTLVVDIEQKDGHIHSLIAHEINSERRFIFTSNVYVDATGDGFLAASAGLSYVIGKESKDTYQEMNAPEQFDPTIQGCTLLMHFVKKDHPIPFIAPTYAYPVDYIENLLNNGGRIVTDASNGCDFWWVEFGGQEDPINAISSITLELKRLTLGIYNYIKNSGKFDADTLELSWIGSLPGKRESRRFKTEYILTERDILQTMQFDDVAFYGGWYLDFHPSGGIYSEADFCTQIPVSLYGIPLRCLYSLKSDNLLLCGRIIGSSHTAFASTRIMDTCALSGQAAGAAAHVLASNHISVNELLKKKIYQKVQTLLDEQDMFLLGYHRGIEHVGIDFLPSSVINSLPGKECGALECNQDYFLAIPTNLAIHSSLVIDVKDEVELQVSYSYSYLPSRNSKQGEWYHDRIRLRKGRSLVDLSAYSKEEKYVLLVLKATEGVSLPIVDKALAGVLCGYSSLATYYNPLLSIRSFDSFGSHVLSNGYTRPYGSANIFLFGEETEPSITISLNQIQEVNALTFFFDCSLSEEMVSSRVQNIDSHHNINLRYGVSPSLVRDFNVYAVVEGNTILLKQVRDNFLRKVNVSVEKMFTDTLFIRFLRTYGAKNTGVYEIQIH